VKGYLGSKRRGQGAKDAAKYHHPTKSHTAPGGSDDTRQKPLQCCNLPDAATVLSEETSVYVHGALERAERAQSLSGVEGARGRAEPPANPQTCTKHMDRLFGSKEGLSAPPGKLPCTAQAAKICEETPEIRRPVVASRGPHPERQTPPPTEGHDQRISRYPSRPAPLYGSNLPHGAVGALL